MLSFLFKKIVSLVEVINTDYVNNYLTASTLYSIVQTTYTVLYVHMYNWEKTFSINSA